MAENIKKLERIIKSLANKRRLAILKHLKINQKSSVGDIAESINLSFKSTSRHLFSLSAAELVEKEQISVKVFYKLNQNQLLFVKNIISLL